RGEGGYRAEGVSERLQQALDVVRDLFVGLVELASQSADVEVVGASEARQLLPDLVGQPERGRSHRAGEAGPVAVDRDLGELTKPCQGGDPHHRYVEHDAAPAS